MAQLAQPVDPFGEVNVYRQPDGRLQVVATVLMEPDIEGAYAGLALDASASMKKMYGANVPLGGAFARASKAVNLVEPVARTMASYLARFSSNGKTRLIYWACSPDGSLIEEIGDVSDSQAQELALRGPKRQSWGRGTKLLPPVTYFVNGAFRDAAWGIAVFVTDGIIEDLEEVKRFSYQYAQQIASGKRNFIKLVLLGVGEEVDEAQMEELDDMFEGSNLRDPRGNPIDLWDHKLAAEMRQLEEIFAEVVSEDLLVCDNGRILDSAGRVARDYSDGMPALLRFTLPAGSSSFTMVIPGGQITQDLTEGLAKL
jgi:hypothetical protein